MTLAEVGWTPQSVVCAAPPIDVQEYFDGFRPEPPKWEVRNVEKPMEVVSVAGPTVGEAIDEIQRTRKAHVETIVLRVVDGEPFRDLAALLKRGVRLEFIESSVAERRACRDYERFEKYISTNLGRLEWLAALKERDYDRKALLEDARRKYPGFPPD
jgi:hypothetical protein